MNDNTEKHDPVEFTVYETAQARADMRFRSMLWVIVFLIIMLVGTNGAWLAYESQFEDTITVTQDTPNGNNSYIGKNGYVINGTTDNN